MISTCGLHDHYNPLFSAHEENDDKDDKDKNADDDDNGVGEDSSQDARAWALCQPL